MVVWKLHCITLVDCRPCADWGASDMDIFIFTLKVFGAISLSCFAAFLLVVAFSSGPAPEDLSDDELEGQ